MYTSPLYKNLKNLISGTNPRGYCLILLQVPWLGLDTAQHTSILLWVFKALPQRRLLQRWNAFHLCDMSLLCDESNVEMPPAGIMSTVNQIKTAEALTTKVWAKNSKWFTSFSSTCYPQSSNPQPKFIVSSVFPKFPFYWSQHSCRCCFSKAAQPSSKRQMFSYI